MKPPLSKTHTQDLLQTLYSMAFLVEARESLYRRPFVAGITVS